MDIQSIKIDLIHWLTELEDISVLEKLQTFKNQEEESLSKAHRDLLDERISSYQENPDSLIDWDDMVKELDERL
ncbi:addiction module protein [Aquiflexum lacus]|uniref:addiction module protein n=1 Tax=Aquiflexum lacus TaxID=2483805 RepID=UPI001895D968|nr:addiction module protein [Aquiflexum lacus]